MVYLFLVHNFELVEALATVDVLRRAKIDVTTVSITDEHEVQSSVNVTVQADKLFSECIFDDAEAVILPGGPGTFGILECQLLCDLVVQKYNEKVLVCAICAAPALLYKLGIKVDTTVFPSMKEEVAQYVGGKVVQDGHVITGEAMGASLDFGLAIISYLRSQELADQISTTIVK
ncbi:MAG: DJ-1/PfpI family protein [Eubacteriales bacterium]